MPRALWLLLPVMLGVSTTVAQQAYEAATVKAAFIYRFTGYIEWPERAAAEREFVIAVLDDAAVAEELSRLLPQRSIRNLPARLKTIDSVHDLDDAQVLYVGPAYAGNLAEIVAALRSKPVLLVTDRSGALDEGSSINFVFVERRVRFEISTAATAHAGLKVGPELLSVATRVKSRAEH